ncbi:hypothetical protein [Streptomyces goshikiensis]|uniref:hypothetical protein n=1 Tax=Streptomyces goshikiensis TaxID=1942 RepID=UPI00332EA64C
MITIEIRVITIALLGHLVRKLPANAVRRNRPGGRINVPSHRTWTVLNVGKFDQSGPPG